LLHPGRPRRGADRAGRADVVGAVALGAGGEVVALDRGGGALARGGARDLARLADLERFDGHGLTDQQLAGLVAELAHVTVSRGVGLLEMTELGSGQRLLLAGAEGELPGLLAVPVQRPDAGHRTGTGLEHGDALDAAVVHE